MDKCQNCVEEACFSYYNTEWGRDCYQRNTFLWLSLLHGDSMSSIRAAALEMMAPTTSYRIEIEKLVEAFEGPSMTLVGIRHVPRASSDY